MTERECKERACPLWDDEIGCPVLAEAGVSLEEAESCSLAGVSIDDGEATE